MATKFTLKRKTYSDDYDDEEYDDYLEDYDQYDEKKFRNMTENQRRDCSEDSESGEPEGNSGRKTGRQNRQT